MILGAGKSLLIENAVAALLNEWADTHEKGTVVIETTDYDIIIENVELLTIDGKDEVKLTIRITGE
jgi:hypothetical protein